MSIFEQVSYGTKSASETAKLAESMTQSLYDKKVTIFLSGELGAGKTLFTKAFAGALHVSDPVVSPSYALEQRYGDILLHADLFRLSQKDAAEMLHHSDEFPGIRIIEWAERAEPPKDLSRIDIRIEETGQETRVIHFTVSDVPLPSDEEIERWRKDVDMLPNIRAHCDLVARTASRIAKDLKSRGMFVREDAVVRAAKVHDLLRFVDFRAMPEGISEKTLRIWNDYKERYGSNHEVAVTAFLKEKGYEALGRICRTHGAPHTEESLPRTVEQKILNYADKRALHDALVTVQERFDDFLVRYGNGKESDASREWRERTLQIEKELYPNGPSF